MIPDGSTAYPSPAGWAPLVRTTLLIYVLNPIKLLADEARDAVIELADLPLEELLDELIERLVHGRPEDDVALVAVRLHRQDQPRPAEAGPNRLPPNVPDDLASA